MRIGIVCPYSFDVPGGVQFHVRDLAEHFLAEGHQASVLAPADEDTPLPDYVESVGRAVPVRYNGSVARLNFGPVTAARVGRWLEQGDFDVLHIHEPVTPSIALLALSWPLTHPDPTRAADLHFRHQLQLFRWDERKIRAGQRTLDQLEASGKITRAMWGERLARKTSGRHAGGDEENRIHGGTV